jgi:hypothetical protein
MPNDIKNRMEKNSLNPFKGQNNETVWAELRSKAIPETKQNFIEEVKRRRSNTENILKAKTE